MSVPQAALKLCTSLNIQESWEATFNEDFIVQLASVWTGRKGEWIWGHSSLASGSAQWETGLGIFPAGMERGGGFLWSSQENPQVSNLMPLPKLGEWWPLNTFHNLHENWSKILPYPCCWLELFYSFTASGSGHSPTVLSCKNTKLKDYLLFQSSHMTINSRQVEKQKTPRVLLSM